MKKRSITHTNFAAQFKLYVCLFCVCNHSFRQHILNVKLIKDIKNDAEHKGIYSN